LDALSHIERCLTSEDDPDLPLGYLAEVPLLRQVPLHVQVDLLADAWARHDRPELNEASLLDAAVVYAACTTAGHIIGGEPGLAVSMLRHGPRKVDRILGRRTSIQLDEMFARFWRDRGFLLIDELQDLPPGEAEHQKTMILLSDEALQPMYDVLCRWHVSSAHVEANLEGLLSDAEIGEVVPILDACTSRQLTRNSEPENSGPLLAGIDDRYHGLSVGPCSPEETAAEATCDLIDAITVRASDFDCMYRQWVESFRDEVFRVARDGIPPVPLSEMIDEPADFAETLYQAQATGLDDGTRIEARGDGWVVVDSALCLLRDANEGVWIVDELDPLLPPAVFSSPDEAFRAWQKAQAASAIRAARRQEALTRLRREGR
jgi:hypothetical protein